jgi:hypothetical protein
VRKRELPPKRWEKRVLYNVRRQCRKEGEQMEVVLSWQGWWKKVETSTDSCARARGCQM